MKFSPWVLLNHGNLCGLRQNLFDFRGKNHLIFKAKKVPKWDFSLTGTLKYYFQNLKKIQCTFLTILNLNFLPAISKIKKLSRMKHPRLGPVVVHPEMVGRGLRPTPN
jgi:hypothetical protein